MAHAPARPGAPRPSTSRVMGFAVFRITSIDSNSVYGYATSGAYAVMNDSGLRRGQVARLVPWN